MPGNSGSPRCSLQMRLLRSSSLTDRGVRRASLKELVRRAPRVRGNSCVALFKQTPLCRDCIRPAESIRVWFDTMNTVETTETTEKPGLLTRYHEITRDVRRGFVAEWTVTIILLLFATTPLE